MDEKNVTESKSLISTFTSLIYTEENKKIGLSPIHFHKDMEFLLVLEGTAEVILEQKRYVLQKDESVLIHPFQTHRILPALGCRVWSATCSLRYIPSLHNVLSDREAKEPVFRLSNEIRNMIVNRIFPAFGNEFSNAVFTLQQEFLIKTCFYAIGCDYVERVELIPADMQDKSVTVAVAQYLSKHFTEGITLRQVASELGYSYQHLSRAFNKAIGISFKELLNQYRIEYAVELLIKTERSITDIAYATGFQSIRSFYRICEKMYGKTPKALRIHD